MKLLIENHFDDIMIIDTGTLSEQEVPSGVKYTKDR